MELRRVDPRILKANAHNPRKIQPGEMSDAALAANIKTVGILQPPEHHFPGFLLALADDDHLDFLADRGVGYDARQVLRVLDVLAVELDDNVAGLDARRFRRAPS